MRIYSITGNSQKLDGGAMFGNAPRELWKRWYDFDEKNRINLNCRALLLKHETRTILFEVGIGNFFPPKFKDRYGVQEDENILLKSLQEIEIKQDEITDVVLSHLHFDHVGGILSEYKQDKPYTLLFPNAQIFVGKKAWERSQNPHFRDKTSFIPELPNLFLKSKRLNIVEFETHHKLPFIKFHFSDGHTPGLMMAEILGERKNVIFASDLIPGATWVHLPLTMGYDRYPELVIEEKQAILEECIQEKKFLFYTHDPKISMSQVQKRNEKIEATNTITKIIDMEI